jgi:HK97 gp10 family phage protein
MGGVTIKLEGVGDVIKVFDELAQEIGDKKARSKILIPAARDAIKPVLALAQQNSPVDTGALRNSINIRQMQSLLWRVQDGPARDGRLYGIYQELGTYKMAAQPFMIPAVEQVSNEYIAMWQGLFS